MKIKKMKMCPSGFEVTEEECGFCSQCRPTPKPKPEPKPTK